MIELTNLNHEAVGTHPMLSGEETKVEAKTQPSIIAVSKPIFSVETCARIELSLVKEIEAVFIDRESDGEFRIVSVVNKRDAAIREKVYAREDEIMSIYPGVRFDFHVLARMDRDLKDVVTKAGKLAFER
jgi:hypothetical protein